MKRGLLVLMMIASGMMVKAGGPIKFELGLVAIPTNTWMVSGDYKSQFNTTPKFTFTMDYGLAGGVYFTERIGIEVDALFGSYKQDFKVDGDIDPEDLDNVSIEVSRTDIPVLFKLGKMMYLEAGAQFSFVNKVERTSEGTFGGTQDISKNYQESQTFLVLGSGVSIGILDKIDLSAGLRLGYGLGDFNSDTPEEYFDGVDANDEAIVKEISQTYRMFGGLKIMAVYKF